MAIRSIAQLKAWFRRGKYPTEEQFSDWMDSYVHKEESKIPIAQIDGLPEQLNKKFSASDGEELIGNQERLCIDFNEHKEYAERFFCVTKKDIESIENENERLWGEIDTLKSGIAQSPSYNVLTLDITELNEPSEIEDGILNASIEEQFAKFNLEKPLHVVLLDDGSLTNCSYETIEDGGPKYYNITAYIEPEYVDWLGGNFIKIRILKSTLKVYSVRISTTKGDTIFLTENGDGMINSVDKNWGTLESKIKAGKTPPVYLKTKNSGIYVPASYEFVKDEETNEYPGKIEITYYNTVNGETGMYVESLRFNKTPGIFAVYEQDIKKINGLNILTINLDLIQDGETISNSQQLQTSVAEQIEKLNLNSKIEVCFIKDNTLYFSGNTKSRISTYTEIISEVPSEIQNLSYSTVSIYIVVVNESTNIQIITSSETSSDILFLTENADYIITAADRNWSTFFKKIGLGLKPSIYLKTPKSELYYPAGYDFTENLSGTITGSVEISYPKTVDGRSELWTEKWVFEGGLYSQHDYTITKTPIGNPVLLVSEYPTDLDSYPEGSIFIKTA